MKAPLKSGFVSLSHPLGVSAFLLAGTIGSLLAGCTQQKADSLRTVDAGDFRSDASGTEMGVGSDNDPVSPGMVRLNPEMGFDTGLGDRAVMSVSVLPGPPELSTEPTVASGPEVFVEAKVGEINGTPVFASEFFDDQFAGRLAANARVETFATWQQNTMLDIRIALNEEIKAALLIQEGRATLTPEQKQGLLFFIDRFEKDLQSKNKGSSQALKRALDEEGKTVREVRDSRERQVLMSQVIQPLYRTIQITPADVEREYRQNYHLFHYGVVQFRLIQVKAENVDDVAAVRAALEAGTPFADVASQDMNTYRQSAGGLRDEADFAGDYDAIELISPALLNQAAHTLDEAGTWVGPIDLNGTFMMWLYCERFDRTDISQFESQMYISKLLGERERAKVINEYVGRLRDRASFTDEEAMADELLEIATERFYEPNAG